MKRSARNYLHRFQFDEAQANALVNTAIEDCAVSTLGVVVTDELHILDDYHRGYLTEIMAIKLLSLEQSIQWIGMSATLSVSVSPYLEAELF